MKRANKSERADRKKKKDKSLFRRYFTMTASIVFACLLCLGTLTIIIIAAQWWDEKIDTLTRNAQSISNAVEEHFSYDEGVEFNENEFYSREFLSGMLTIMSQATNSDYFVANESGKIVMCKETYNLLESDRQCQEHSEMIIPAEYMQRALKNGFSDYATDEVLGLGKFIVAVPITLENTGKTYVAFAIEDAITGLFPYVLNTMNIFAIMMLVFLILSFIIIYYFSKGLTEPLSEMQEVTRHFAKGEFKSRANENYKRGYLSSFAKSLNKMADELAANDKAQKSFVANVSHELKTPMTTIGGFIDGILDGTIPPQQQGRYLQIVSSEIKRLSRTVVSMLNLSKIEAGEVSLAPVKYDVVKQILDTLLSFEKIISEKHICVEGFESLSVVEIRADKDLMQQVIYNLVDNAVKFTPENGKISVFAQNNGEKTLVRIKNTGTKISKEEISRIFERFYKVDKSRSFDTKGVGLGLYIVKTIINMHDGEISAKSEEPNSVEFSFELSF